MVSLAAVVAALRFLVIAAAKVSDDPASCSTSGNSMLQIRTEAKVRAHAEVRHKGLQLSEHLSAVARRHAAGSPTAELLRSFRICGNCKEFKRLGEAHDGGYLTCMDGLSSAGLRAAYSLGVEHHDKWSDDASHVFGVLVNQFDCTVSQGTGCKGCEFFPQCIIGEDQGLPASLSRFGDTGWTLREALAHTGQANATDRSLIMKVDIESSEWPLFASASPDVLKKFKEIIVEFHWLKKSLEHEQYLAALQRILDAGFKVVHLHGNNGAGMYDADGGSHVPDILEVTFVAGAEMRHSCLRDQEYLSLDSRNIIGAGELPMAHLP